MDWMMAGLPPGMFAVIVGVTLFAGFVKGAVGFAMPLIMMGVFSAFLTPHMALVALILPTLVTNLAQTFRDGPRAALDSVITYRRYLVALVIFIGISAQFIHVIPRMVFLLVLGIPITAYAAMQLSGRPLMLPMRNRARVEWLTGMVSGLFGGIAGIWGAPLIVYLLSAGVQKDEMLRVQGVVFEIGAIVLLMAHLQSGVLNATTAPFSAALVVPAMLGLVAGQRLSRRLDQARFRWWTQLLLAATGLNLIWSALN